MTDIESLLKYDITGIPALALNGKVIAQKVVPEVEDLKIAFQLLLNETEADFPIRRIIVPTDFSDTSKKALDFAAKLAKEVKAKLKLVHIHQPHLEPQDSLNPEPKIMDAEACRNLLRTFPGNTMSLKERRNLMEEPEVISGHTVEQILAISRQPECDLIVMGTTGHGGFLEKLFGSVSSEVARKAYSPVLLIPDGVSFEGFKKIIFANDHHPEDAKILPQLLHFSRRFEAIIHMVHINENKEDSFLISESGDGKLFHFDETTLRMALVESKDRMEGLNRYATEQEADLLVMTTRHRNFMEELFHKSMTRRMVFNAKLPLMVLHFDS